MALMNNWFTDMFKIERKPRRGLLAYEWIVLGYLLLTLTIVLFTYTRIANPDALIWGRLRVAATIVAMWVVYRLVPCRFTLLLRAIVQLVLLGWWYPDTYAINSLFPNLDHVFAQYEQTLFGFQPALVFAHNFPSPVISEALSFGYWFYYFLIAIVSVYYFFARGKEFERCVTVIIASFFGFYLIFDFLPVAGPTFYYHAVGLDNIANGVFPNVGYYFASHRECLPTPGYTDGVFYQLVEAAKAAGERPTAAFPSSHVGAAVVCLLLAVRTRKAWLITLFSIVFILLSLATVYIQAHYAIDAMAGLIVGVTFYFVFWFVSGKARQ
jgi:membrane-associated phospholipid phosphatase